VPPRRQAGWLAALALLALPAWAADQAGRGNAAASSSAAPAAAVQADVSSVNRRIQHRSDELSQLQRQVDEQETKSRQADTRLHEQDRAIEALRRQLRQAAPDPATTPAKP
jgi:septal ring factor EnvC (AmiA/AmiB activator)